MKASIAHGSISWLVLSAFAAATPAGEGSGRVVQIPLAAPNGTVSELLPITGPGLAPIPPGVPAPSLAPPTWQQASVPGGLFLRAICIATSTIGFAAGELGVVLKSTDGGASWQVILNDGFPYYYYGCQATSAQSVVVSGFNNQTGEGILRWSEDSGASWGPIVVLPGPASGVQWLDRIEFANVADGLVTAAWAGGVHSTQNGGRVASDWTYTQAAANWLSGTFTFHSDARAWVAGFDMVFSPDTGSTWAPFSGTNAIFDGPVSVHNNGFGYTGGGSISPTVEGWIYQTANGGNTWGASPAATLAYPVRGLLAFDLDRAWAVGGNVFSGVGGIWGKDATQAWALQQDTGTEMNDLDSVRIDNDTVRVFAAGYNSQIWFTNLAIPVNSGLVATGFGFCNYAYAPCGNVYNNAGCANMAGAGCLLAGVGTSSVAADDLVLMATQLPPNKLGAMFMGPSSQVLPSGNGLLVLAAGGTGLHRFPVHSANAQGVLTQGPGIVAHSNAHFPVSAQIQPGQTWNFQAYSRDPQGPCGATWNFSNGFSVAFIP